MKKALPVILILAVLILLPLLFIDRIAHRQLEKTIAAETGFQAAAGEVHVGVINPVIAIRDLVLRNPPGYPHDEAFTVRELTVEYDRLSLFTRQIKLYNIVLDVPRIVMVRPETGGSNIEELAGIGKKDKAAPPAPAPAPAPESPAPAPEPKAGQPERTIAIDSLTIRLGEMEVRQYRPNQPEPSVVSIPVGFDRTYQNVTNMEAVATQIATELVVKSSLGFLGELGKLAEEGENKDAVQKIKDQFKELKNMFRGEKKNEE